MPFALFYSILYHHSQTPSLPSVSYHLLCRMEKNSLSAEQFAKTRRPFPYPVISKLPVAERAPSHDYLMQQLRGEEVDRLKHLPRQVADFKVGDRVAVTTLLTLSPTGKNADKVEVIKGVVLERRRREQLDASFTIRNSSVGVAYELSFPLWSPFIRKIEVLDRATDVRRAKLFYYRRLPMSDRRNRPIS